jgi:hypothetical protein
MAQRDEMVDDERGARQVVVDDRVVLLGGVVVPYHHGGTVFAVAMTCDRDIEGATRMSPSMARSIMASARRDWWRELKPPDPASTWKSVFARASVTPSRISPWKGFRMLSSSIPIVKLRPRMPRAAACGR